VTGLDRGVGFAIALVATAGIAWGSNFPMTPHASPDAVLRLAWTARPERVEDCRPQSDEELAKLPVHMRQSMVCEGTTASYRLEVRREGTLVAEQTVRGGGLHHDRPLYVFRDIPMPAGETAITIRFSRLETTTTITPGARAPAASPAGKPAPADAVRQTNSMDPERRRREGEERLLQRSEAVPASLSLETTFHFLPREVILVTYDVERRDLLAVERSPR
jgi:hypothetical protein